MDYHELIKELNTNLKGLVPFAIIQKTASEIIKVEKKEIEELSKLSLYVTIYNQYVIVRGKRITSDKAKENARLVKQWIGDNYKYGSTNCSVCVDHTIKLMINIINQNRNLMENV